MNLEWTFVLFTHFGVTTMQGSLRDSEWSLRSLQNEWITHVHSKFTLISLFSKIHSFKSEHIHFFCLESKPIPPLCDVHSLIFSFMSRICCMNSSDFTTMYSLIVLNHCYTFLIVCFGNGLCWFLHILMYSRFCLVLFLFCLFLSLIF